MTHARRIPISRVDRLWLGSSVITTVGPLRVPPREQIVAAFVRLAASGPGARIGLRFDPTSSTHWLWQPDDLEQWAQSCVVDLPPGADDDLDGLMSRMTDDRPVRFYLGDRHVLVLVSHALGDSRLSLALPSIVVALASGAQLPTWATARIDPHPLRTALRHTFPRRASVPAVLHEWRTARAERAAHPLDADDGPAGVPFRPMPTAITESGPAQRTRDLRRWTGENLPGAAHFAVVLAAVHRSLAEHGILAAPGVHMVFDLHRYLPRGAHTTGNFVGGVDLPLSVTDPVAVTDLVRRTARTGRPLVSVAAAIAVTALRRRRPAATSHVPERPRARLALSYIGAKSFDESLPWLAEPGHRSYWSRVDPAGPTAITLLVAVVDDRLLLSASFHATVFDPAAVRAALRAVQDDAIGLVQRAGAVQAR